MNPPSTYSEKMERVEAGVVRCTYINIKDIPKKPKSLQWHDFECITWCMQWANKYDTLLLAISKWIFFKWLKWTYGGCGCGPLSFKCFHVVDGSMVVFDLLHRKCFGSSYTHTSSVHLTLIYWKSKTGKKKFGRNPNALATCCAIEYVFRCGWCVNSLQLQIQVIFNTSSFPNWNLFRNAAYFSSTPKLHCLPNDY